MLTTNLENVSEVKRIIAEQISILVGENVGKILAGYNAKNAEVEARIAAITESKKQSEELLSAMPDDNPLKALASMGLSAFDNSMKETAKELLPVPSEEEISANLTKNVVDKIIAKLELSEVNTRKRGASKGDFKNRWAGVSTYLGAGLLFYNYRVLPNAQKEAFNLTNASQWLVMQLGTDGKFHKLFTMETNSPSDLWNETRQQVKGERYTSKTQYVGLKGSPWSDEPEDQNKALTGQALENSLKNTFGVVTHE